MTRTVKLYSPYVVLLLGALAINSLGRSDLLIIVLLIMLAVTGVFHTLQLVKDHNGRRHS